MNTATRISTLRRAGLRRDTIAAVLGIDPIDVAEFNEDPSHVPALGGGEVDLSNYDGGIRATENIWSDQQVSGRSVFANFRDLDSLTNPAIGVMNWDSDLEPRFQVLNNGNLAWGDGADAADTTLERDQVGRLRVNTKLDVGDAGGTQVRLNKGGQGDIAITAAATNTWVFSSDTGTEDDSLFVVQADGKVLWGDGTAAPDASLHRVATGWLAVTAPGRAEFLVGSADYTGYGVDLYDGRCYFLGETGQQSGYVGAWDENSELRIFGNGGIRIASMLNWGTSDDPDVSLGASGAGLQLFGANADFYFEEVGAGPIVRSPDGTRYRVKVANGGALSTVAA